MRARIVGLGILAGMILVTGGCGFIGARFVIDWLAGFDEALLDLDALTCAVRPQAAQQSRRHAATNTRRRPVWSALGPARYEQHFGRFMPDREAAIALSLPTPRSNI